MFKFPWGNKTGDKKLHNGINGKIVGIGGKKQIDKIKRMKTRHQSLPKVEITGNSFVVSPSEIIINFSIAVFFMAIFKDMVVNLTKFVGVRVWDRIEKF